MARPLGERAERKEKVDCVSPREPQHLKARERRVSKEDRTGGWRGRRGTKSVPPGSRG